MDLFIKAGPTGTCVGDCPFAHYVRCVLNFKGLECNIVPCKSDTKPAWLVNEFNGKMPCLRSGDIKIVESGDITEYLEKTYPEPSLSVPNLDEAHSIQAPVFPAFARLLKSPEFIKENEKKLMDELRKLDDHFATHKYLAGDKLSLADYSLAPKLYHLDIALGHFYPATRNEIRQEYKNVDNYISLMFEDSVFEATKCAHDVVIWGWTNARSAAASVTK